jgi:hypothetical protein
MRLTKERPGSREVGKRSAMPQSTSDITGLISPRIVFRTA